jgi:hypothetical protein
MKPGSRNVARNFFYARLTETQAKKLIDHLASEGFLKQAVELDKQKIPRRDLTKDCFTLQVSLENGDGDFVLHEELGWGPAMLKRLDGLHAALEGDAAGAMAEILATLTEERKQWEKKTP